LGGLDRFNGKVIDLFLNLKIEDAEGESPVFHQVRVTKQDKVCRELRGFGDPEFLVGVFWIFEGKGFDDLPRDMGFHSLVTLEIRDLNDVDRGNFHVLINFPGKVFFSGGLEIGFGLFLCFFKEDFGEEIRMIRTIWVSVQKGESGELGVIIVKFTGIAEAVGRGVDHGAVLGKNDDIFPLLHYGNGCGASKGGKANSKSCCNGKELRTQSIGINFLMTSFGVCLWHLGMLLVDLIFDYFAKTILAVSGIAGGVSGGAASVMAGSTVTITSWPIWAAALVMIAVVVNCFYLSVPAVISYLLKGANPVTAGATEGMKTGASFGSGAMQMGTALAGLSAAKDAANAASSLTSSMGNSTPSSSPISSNPSSIPSGAPGSSAGGGSGGGGPAPAAESATQIMDDIGASKPGYVVPPPSYIAAQMEKPSSAQLKANIDRV